MPCSGDGIVAAEPVGRSGRRFRATAPKRFVAGAARAAGPSGLGRGRGCGERTAAWLVDRRPGADLFHLQRPDAPWCRGGGAPICKALGLKVEMISGDATPAVAAFRGPAWHRSDVTAEALPDDKAARISALNAAGAPGADGRRRAERHRRTGGCSCLDLPCLAHWMPPAWPPTSCCWARTSRRLPLP